jgi:putative transposase
MRHHDRRLPHWDSIEQPLFVTFRLYGSLPRPRNFPPAHLSSGRAFVALDRLLDHPTSGPMFLQQPEIARLLVQALHDGETRFHRYELHAYVAMPTHVHLLVTPHVSARQWLGPLKGFTAHEANRILGRTGAFWQDESYDHLVRDGPEFERIRCYIEQNPVKAGLVPSAEQYPWSSAAPGQSPAAG